MVKSNGTLINKEDTSKETNFELLSKGATFLNFWINSLQFHKFSIEPVGCSFEPFSFVILLFNLRTHLWILLSIRFFGSFFRIFRSVHNNDTSLFILFLNSNCFIISEISNDMLVFVWSFYLVALMAYISKFIFQLRQFVLRNVGNTW